MTRYETPAFDPGIAFSWTLRSEEIARRQTQRPRDPHADRRQFADETGDETQVSEYAAGYETPAFAPGIAFSWTLRSAEIARRQGRQPFSSKPDLTHLNVLAAA
jgi:hypothetical protein